MGLYGEITTFRSPPLHGSWRFEVTGLVEVMRLVESTCARLSVRLHGEEPEAEDSGRLQAPNLGEAVRDAVGEMCPNPAPPLLKRPANAGFFHARL
jgi:hypothetical protein